MIEVIAIDSKSSHSISPEQMVIEWRDFFVSPQDNADVWGQSRKQLSRHGFAALFYYMLKLHKQIAYLPEQGQQALAKETAQQAVFEITRQWELQSVLSALAAANISPLILKGGALAYSHYEQPYLRPRCDTDLLIEKQHLEAVEPILATLGYTRLVSVSGDVIMHQATYRKTDSQGLRHDLDFHWKISNSSHFSTIFDYQELSTRAEPLPQLSPVAKVPSAIDALLIACIHRVAHHRNDDRWIWLYDIHLLASRLSETEFIEFGKLAVAKKVRAICYEGLRLAQTRFHTMWPASVDAILCQGQEAEFSQQYLQIGMPNWKRLWLSLKAQSLPNRLKYLKETIFPEPKYLLIRYKVSNPLLLPLLYLHRALYGAWRHLSGMMG